MDVTALSQSQLSDQPNQVSGNSLGAMSSTEFLQLIITDLLNQDPLEPMDNEKLLQQIAFIREIEMNNEVTTSLRSLIDQQRFGSSATLIGQFVEAVDHEGIGTVGGVVTGVRFDDQGTPILMLDSGHEVPLSALKTVTSLEVIAESLMHKLVTAEVFQNGEVKEIEGVVTEVKNTSGRITLELDTGEVVALSDVKSQRSLS